MSTTDPPKTPTGSSSTSDTRPTRYESITGSNQEEDVSQGNVRPRSIGEARRDYGTMESQDGGSSSRPLSRRQSNPQITTKDFTASPPPTTPLSPPIISRPKKPPVPRRTSTARKAGPRRGEHFSVDDDASEVEEERTPITPNRPSFPPANRPSSTVRRRPTQQVTILPRVDSHGEEEDDTHSATELRDSIHENIEDGDIDGSDREEDVIDDGDDELSDAESFTLRDRQLAINETHPFGIRIWKPALYKKNRSVEKGAEEDIHSSPSAIVSQWLWGFNCMWTVLFGWWLALAVALASAVCYIFAFEPSAAEYGRVFWGLAGYLFWPFGQFVKLEQDENYVEEDEGEGRSISEYERWQSGDLEYGRLMFGPTITHTGSIVGRHRDSIDSTSERDSLLDRSTRDDRAETGLSHRKRRLFGRGQWTLGRVIFFGFFYFLIAPLMLLVSGICWFMVFWIPMGRVTLILFYHLRKRPLSLSFHPDASYARTATKPSSILICTYRAVGIKYWKYTVEGTNIFLINFLGIVVFVIVDYFVLKEALGLEFWLTSPALLFTLALVSVIPLAYFIGQAVASISAQSSMGMGAAVNAFFSTIVEVYLYCIALNEGKAPLVEGSVIGSVFAGVLLLPGLSMCFGAIKRKTQRFNVKSAGATTTMLLFAVIALFGPTLFYKIYGAHELICKSCTTSDIEAPRDCRQCYFRQVPAINDDFFVDAVRPYCWFSAVLLFSSYIIGLLFTLRTHAAVIWSTDADEKKPAAVPPVVMPTTEISPTDTRHHATVNGPSLLTGANGPGNSRTTIRDSQLYKRILGQSLRQVGLRSVGPDGYFERDSVASSRPGSELHGVDSLNKNSLPHVVPPKTSDGSTITSPLLKPIVPGLSEEDNTNLVRQVAEIAATAAAITAREASGQHPRTTSYQATHAPPSHSHSHDSVKARRPSATRGSTALTQSQVLPAAEHETPGGHDAPNWSRTKSSVILITATVAYAVVAEVLVNTVDVVLESVDIDEKFLGITLFALVPNTTEFLNGISFAMNGNIALSMEIGSAYALQVCLLQVPALVLFSAVHGRYIDPSDLLDHTFNLIFPQWDMVTVILCVFLLSYMYGEGKSNYFKGSILVMTYLVVVMGFYYSGYTAMDVLGVDPSDTLAIVGSMAWQSKQGGGAGTAAARLKKRGEL